MGACSVKNKMKKINENLFNIEKQIYSINKIGSELIPVKKIKKPLKFEIRIHNFKGRGLKENKFYYGKIDFDSDDDQTFELNSSKGPEPKFLLDKVFYIEVDFEKLKSKTMNLHLFSYNQTKEKASSYCKTNKQIKENHEAVSILCIDYLTLILGPEHHDINIIHFKENKIIGRISFDIQCQQVEYVSLHIDALRCKLFHCFNNEILFKLKYLNNDSYLESGYTIPVHGKISNKDDFTIYKWREDKSDSNNRLNLENLLLSVHELKRCNLELRLFEIKYELDGDKSNEQEMQKSNTYFNDDFENVKKNKSKFTEIKEEDTNNIIYTENELDAKVCKKETTKIVIIRENVIERFDPLNEKIFVKQESDEKKIILEVNTHHNEIGYSRINFYNVLAQQDNLISNQSSQVFHKFSYLYNDKNSPSHERKSSFFNTTGTLNGEQVNTNINDKRNTIPNISSNILSYINQNNNPEDENDNLKYIEKETNKIHFKVFNNIKKSLFKQEIIVNGKVIGELEGTINLHHIPMIRQMVCGVHTERGLDITDNFLFNNEVGKLKNEKVNEETLPDEIKQISNLTKNLISKIIDSTSMQNAFTYREVGIQIVGVLNEIIKLILKTHNQKDKDMLIFEYKSEFDLMRSQHILLDLGLNLLHMLDTLNHDGRSLCFQIIEILLEREEFCLSSMTIIASSISNKDKGQIKEKVLEDYLEFFNKTLEYTLDKLSSKVSDAKTKNFIESFLAIAYLRIPKFQIAFLESVNKNVNINCMDCIYPFICGKIDSNFNSNNLLNFPSKTNTNSVSENLQLQSFLMNTSNMKNQNNPKVVISLIDWQVLFYDKLEIIKENINFSFNDKIKELEEILFKKTCWQERIAKRGLGFFYVVSHITSYIIKKLPVGADKNINWIEIPGFKIIINSIIHELNSKIVYAYPQPLIDILKIFINDYGIINKFYKTIIDKTNAYDSLSVYKSIKIIDTLFEEYEKKKQTSDFIYKFDYNLLKKAANAIFAVDHSVCVAKLIWLYYKNTHIMNIVHVHEIFSEYFKPKFFSLFFHWSWQVRNTFYYFIWFIINHRLKNKNFSTQLSQICKERLEFLTNKDDVGFFKAFNTDYPEELKKLILGDYYEKMRIIEIIRSIVKKEKLDPTFKSEFNTTDQKILSNINDDIKNNIVVGIYHYDLVEKFYRNWERENRNAKEIKYPEVEIYPPKDDIAEYTSENLDAWRKLS